MEESVDQHAHAMESLPEETGAIKQSLSWQHGLRRRMVGTVAALGISLMAPVGANADNTGVETPVVNGQNTVIVPATTHTDRVVLYLHGAGETAQSLVTDPEKAGIVETLCTHRFALAASDAEGPYNWGRETSVNDYVDLTHYLAHKGLTRIYILAQSMGGLDGMQLLGRLHVNAWAGIYPLTNLDTITPSDEPLIEQALGSSFDYYWQKLSPVRPRHVRNLPMIFWASPDDQTVPKSLNTDITAAEASRDGADVTVVPTVGNHGDISNFQPLRLLNFFRLAGKA